MSATVYSNEPYADLYGEEVMKLLRERAKRDEELDLIAPIGMPDSVDRETGEQLDIFDEEEIAFCNECENTCTKAALTFDRECPFCLSDEISFGRLEDFPSNDETTVDSFADGEALASAGFGTDEDYGFYGDFE